MSRFTILDEVWGRLSTSDDPRALHLGVGRVGPVVNTHDGALAVRGA